MDKLPEKWCVRVNDNNRDFLHKHIKSSYNLKGINYLNFIENVYVSHGKSNGYIEISFEDFERLVLKKSITKSLFKI